MQLFSQPWTLKRWLGEPVYMRLPKECEWLNTMYVCVCVGASVFEILQQSLIWLNEIAWIKWNFLFEHWKEGKNKSIFGDHFQSGAKEMRKKTIFLLSTLMSKRIRFTFKWLNFSMECIWNTSFACAWQIKGGFKDNAAQKRTVFWLLSFGEFVPLKISYLLSWQCYSQFFFPSSINSSHKFNVTLLKLWF